MVEVGEPSNNGGDSGGHARARSLTHDSIRSYKFKKRNECNAKVLPDEVVHQIMQNIYGEEKEGVLRYSKVCSQWSRIIRGMVECMATARVDRPMDKLSRLRLPNLLVLEISQSIPNNLRWRTVFESFAIGCPRIHSLGLSELKPLLQPNELDALPLHFPNLTKLSLHQSSDTPHLPCSFNFLTALETLALEREEFTELPTLTKLTKLHTLTVRSCSKLKSSWSLRQFAPNLQKLEVLSSEPPCLFSLRYLSRLEHLTISKKLCSNTRDYSSAYVEKLTGLRHLDLSKSIFNCVIGLAKLTQLSSLRLPSIFKLSPDDVAAISELHLLGELQCTLGKNAANVHLLGNISALRKLDLVIDPWLNYTAGVTFPAVESLSLVSELNEMFITLDRPHAVKRLSMKFADVRHFPALSTMPGLEELEILDCYALEVLPPLNQHVLLTRLEISDAKLESLPLLGAALVFLEIRKCRQLKQIADLSSLPNLASIRIDDSPLLAAIPNLSPSLQKLELVGCSALVTLPPLEGLQRLHTLILEKCAKLEAVWSLKRLASLKFVTFDQCPKLKQLPASDLAWALEVDRTRYRGFR